MVGAPFQRALVIRGGALGDFLLTLPVLQSLRAAAPSSRVELLAYPGLGTLAKNAGIIDEVRSIEYGPMAGFFTRGAVLDPDLREYFGSFDLVVSYLYDPDGIFHENLRASGARRVVIGPHRPGSGAHAIDQLAAPLADLGLPLCGRASRIDTQRVEHAAPTVAIHPGSGSAAKNWPAENWRQLAECLLVDNPGIRLAVIGGEADESGLAALRDLAPRESVVFWENLPLTDLAERLAGAHLYLGHDTGITHLAAAAGVPSLLLFGPTDPGVWSPPHDHVRVLRAPEGRLENLAVNTVMGAVRPLVPAKVRGIFSSIAERYDLANHLLSGGLDLLWRARAVRMVEKWQPRSILDLATGSGDLALAMQKKISQARIVGADFCLPMLKIAARKHLRPLVVADGTNLPFADGSFDAVTVAFGLRNMEAWPGALREMSRVLSPGGHLLILDFSLPRPPLDAPYRFYLHRVLPKIAGVLTGNRAGYEYLGESIESFPSGEAMCRLIEDNNFRDARALPLAAGIVSIYTAVKS